MNITKRYQASMTVEAVFIVPIIIFTIFFFLYFTMYMHDKSILYSVCNEGIEREDLVLHQPRDLREGKIYYSKITERSILFNLTDDCNEENEELKSYIKEELEKRLYMCSVDNIEVTKDFNELHVKAKIKLKVNFGVSFLSTDSFINTTCNVDKEIHNPADFARRCENFLDVISDVKGFDRILNVFQKLQNLIK